MLVIRPHIFNPYTEVICAFSTKSGFSRKAPYFFNMSYKVGDIKENVKKNRQAFFNIIGLDESTVSSQKQVHGDKVSTTNKASYCDESDGLITTKPDLGLIISSADCPAIFIYDKKIKLVAAIHSGWRGTAKKILAKTLFKLSNDFNSQSKDLICYIGPSISQSNYEIGDDVADNFNNDFILAKNDKYFLDLKSANYKILLDAGVKKTNIQVSKLCSYEYSNLLHSYRRSGEKSGRAIGVIYMRDKL
ncbi:MAG: peptidoglycan editing factor PgeF [Ignavibacteria bacterium]|nr:peptidoglycan editing factor PgeF [Ignavibacteria bacterium]MBT8380903.1 peptidoglycan editing factor PgeF [Ignavibacteria bacterium]MBT8391018.1 peptidoglycan editing factor PgeF [Ignavibacteria bacterium]NNJ54166.1 peptidoglycan editing factor PgeF [Ignavibacteriaceae bacterium]NNL20673.1 peptidoglycan editing factor PgeF [Ignavibacteriaceae bacterium]